MLNYPKFLFIPFCNGSPCQFQPIADHPFSSWEEGYEWKCSTPPHEHSFVNYVCNAHVKEFRTEESIERWGKYLETKDERYLDSDRTLEFALASDGKTFVPVKG